MLVYSFLGKAVYEFLYIAGGYLVKAQVSYCFVNALGKLTLTSECSAFQIEFSVFFKPFFG